MESGDETKIAFYDGYNPLTIFRHLKKLQEAWHPQNTLPTTVIVKFSVLQAENSPNHRIERAPFIYHLVTHWEALRFELSMIGMILLAYVIRMAKLAMVLLYRPSSVNRPNTL